MNNAPVSGFERDAGSRTTVRLMYPEGAPLSPSEYRHTSLVTLVVYKCLDLDWLTSVITKQPLVGMCLLPVCFPVCLFVSLSETQWLEEF